jgi:hypothetical protein
MPFLCDSFIHFSTPICYRRTHPTCGSASGGAEKKRQKALAPCLAYGFIAEEGYFA